MVELSPRKNIRCQSTQAVLSPESLLAIEDLAILAVFTDQDQRRSQPQTSVCVWGGGREILLLNTQNNKGSRGMVRRI